MRRTTKLAGAVVLCLAALAGAAAAAVPPEGPVTRQQLQERYAQRGSRYMTIKGVEVHYMDEGSGPVILMIHGSSSTLKTYDRVAKALKSRYRVIRYDIPPSGLSGPVPDSVLKDLQPAEVPEILLTRLGVKSATVVGVSSGGTTAWFLAARRPDLVERLVLSNAPSSLVREEGVKRSPRLYAEMDLARKDRIKRRAYWDAFFDFYTGEPERMTPAMRDEYYDMNRRIEENPSELVAKVEDQAVARATAAKVTVPVLLAWGGRDPLLRPESADNLASYLKNAKVSKLMMPDVSHYPPLEAPERFAAIVAAYIEAVTPVAPKAPDPADR